MPYGKVHVHLNHKTQIAMNTQTLPADYSKKVLTVELLTIAQIRSMNREYNAVEWDKKIDRLKGYQGVQFYLAPAEANGNSYDKYYATYTTEEGITFFGEVSYASVLSGAGFCRIQIIDNEVYRVLLSDGRGNYGHCANDKDNRKIMAKNSTQLGVIYSNQF